MRQMVADLGDEMKSIAMLVAVAAFSLSAVAADKVPAKQMTEAQMQAIAGGNNGASVDPTLGSRGAAVSWNNGTAVRDNKYTCVNLCY
jgi:hypothetical protein